MTGRKNMFFSQTKQLSHIYLWVLSFLKPHKWLLFGVVSCIILITSVELIIPKVIQHFIDVLIPTNNYESFLRTLVIISAMVILVVVAMAINNLLLRSLREKAARDMQLAIFQKLRKLGFSYFEQHPVGETLALMNSEVTNVQIIYREFIPALIKAVIFSTISLIFLFFISVKLTLIVIPCLMLYAIFGMKYETRSNEEGEKMSARRIDYNQKIYDTVSALSELRVHSSEDWDRKIVLSKLRAFNKSVVITYFYAFFQGSIRRFSFYVGGILIILLGYWDLQQNLLSIGEFTAFLLYYFNAMLQLSYVLISLNEQKVLMNQSKRLYNLMITPVQINDPESPVPVLPVSGEITFKGVDFSYDTSRQVLKHFDMHVRPGEHVAIVGTSGTGKSTILKLIGRFYDPQSGVIMVDNVPLQDIKLAELRESLGFVFQETFIFGETIMENIRFGKPQASDDEVFLAAKAAFADEFIVKFPDGYHTLLGERGVNLSGGQKQRISIARLFLKNPSIVLLDEATSALDNISEQRVKQALDQLLHDRTTIAIAHRLSSIQDFDRIIVMDDGKVIEEGTFEQLLRHNGLFYQLYMGDSDKKDEVRRSYEKY
ncbi:ABC transporter ATP-binding protein [Paenibacillus sp. FSL M8-0212]|uniref:ABC transporter ATP-binding protein n=1 Tax=Paenibacillus sp. FSL M8-0212 TaxID=2921618 RepID=UPI0030FC1BAA